MNVKKMAAKDAAEYAAASMAHGEGAGVRRRLIEATVQQRIMFDANYAAAFKKSLLEQDMSQHAKAAIRAHRTKVASQAISRNTRGLLTGDIKSVNTSVIVVLGTAYFAHRYGWDKKAVVKIKETYHKVEVRFKARVYVNNIMNGK
jgi:hypothetical protein